MTKELDIESIQPAIAELERAARWAADNLGMDVLADKITIVVQSRGRKSKCRGWFIGKQWSTREGEAVHEVSISAEYLNEDPVEIAGTVIHELVHVWCNLIGVKDHSKFGRHNKHFKEYAGIVGLECEKPRDSYGYGYTTVSDDLNHRIRRELQLNVSAFQVFRQPNQKAESTTAKPTAYVCQCTKPVKIRTTRDDFSIKCNKCGTDYTAEDAK